MQYRMLLLMILLADLRMCWSSEASYDEEIMPQIKLTSKRVDPPSRSAPNFHSRLHDQSTLLEKARRTVRDRSQNFNEKMANYRMSEEVGAGGNYGTYGTQSGAYEKSARSSRVQNAIKSKPTNVARDEGGEKRQVVAGVPDQSDPCFRRYANVIVVNAQPYERRSRTSLPQCKQHCQISQSGVYSCRSFVFDHVNEVCDLFAHAGDQAPARLLKFQTRDYFEPTLAPECQTAALTQETTLATTTRQATTKAISDRAPVAHATNIDEREPGLVNPPENLLPRASPPPTVPPDLFEGEQGEIPPQGTQCPPGKTTRYLRTQGFELYNNDDAQLDDVTEQDCMDACDRNQLAGRGGSCRSFDYADSSCSLTAESAVPLGNGQLKARKEAFYYEKLCIAENVARRCERIFERFPQMILVGFAETVTDSATFEQCFESCLNSFTLYGFNCTSGMYYFEESQLNCILNTEDRRTQSELFAEENTDIVDYFEVRCGGEGIRRREPSRGSWNGDGGQRMMLGDSKQNGLGSSLERSQNLVLAGQTTTEWSECENGRQHRRVDCPAMEGKECGLQSRPCQDPAKSIPKRRIGKEGFKCPKGRCCAVFGGCEVGLRQNEETGRLEWCRDACKMSHIGGKRRRV